MVIYSVDCKTSIVSHQRMYTNKKWEQFDLHNALVFLKLIIL